jgi:hypothetical protein
MSTINYDTAYNFLMRMSLVANPSQRTQRISRDDPGSLAEKFLGNRVTQTEHTLVHESVNTLISSSNFLKTRHVEQQTTAMVFQTPGNITLYARNNDPA